jgi:fructose-1,6-bisphosphatase/inositol monophosphatase family enzyme/GNAT superfamily N-acetyltransferase
VARIRRAIAGDAEKICSLHTASIRGLCGSHYSSEEIESWAGPKQASDYRKPIEETVVLVAEVRKQLAGFAQLDPRSGELHALYVDPAHAGTGVGTRLLAAVEEQAAWAGLTAVGLNATLNSVSFYEARDYVSKEEDVNRLPSGRELRCERMEKSLREGDSQSRGEPTEDSLRLLLDRALDISRGARRLILDRLDRGFAYELKSDGSFVSEVDLEVEQYVRDNLERDLPGHGILGEEMGSLASSSDFEWMIDPIDGTHSLRHRIPLFGSMLALQFKNEPVIGVLDLPLLDRCYYAVRGLGSFCNGRSIELGGAGKETVIEEEILAVGERRQFVKAGKVELFDQLMVSHPSVRTYCDCFGHALAIEGAVGAMVDVHLGGWDIAATRVLVSEAGGKFVMLEIREGGDRRRFDVVFGKPEVVTWLVETLGLDAGASGLDGI